MFGVALLNEEVWLPNSKRDRAKLGVLNRGALLQCRLDMASWTLWRGRRRSRQRSIVSPHRCIGGARCEERRVDEKVFRSGVCSGVRIVLDRFYGRLRPLELVNRLDDPAGNAEARRISAMATQ